MKKPCVHLCSPNGPGSPGGPCGPGAPGKPFPGEPGTPANPGGPGYPRSPCFSGQNKKTIQCSELEGQTVNYMVCTLHQASVWQYL